MKVLRLVFARMPLQCPHYKVYILLNLLAVHVHPLPFYHETLHFSHPRNLAAVCMM